MKSRVIVVLDKKQKLTNRICIYIYFMRALEIIRMPGEIWIAKQIRLKVSGKLPTSSNVKTPPL